MPRYGCFEIRTSCNNCGQPVPINGPFRSITCTSCFETVRISADTLAGFFNNFEEEFEGLEMGEGSGGTLMGGGGTFEYSYWRLEPRCSSCKTPLPKSDSNTDETIACTKCGTAHEVYPAPNWLKELVPSVRQCYSVEREHPKEGNAVMQVDEALKPVVMSCPQCGGTLSITALSQRILTCEYCEVEVYVPDAIWTRLHPVETTAEWFLAFEGKPPKEMEAEQRIKDEQEEKEALKKWRPRPMRKAPKSMAPKMLRVPFVIGITLISSVLLMMLTTAIMLAIGYDLQTIESVAPFIMKVVIIGGIVVIALLGSFHSNITYRYGFPGKCKKAMAELAKKHNWKHTGAEYRNSMGFIDATYRGREVEIDPDSDYAIEVDIDDSPYFLKTEPPSYAPEGLQRFSTGDPRFDETFPIRYANPALLKQMQKSSEAKADLLSPFFWFLERWGDKLGMLKVDWSSISVHLAPGHEEKSFSSTRYLYPDELEPLLEDMIVTAKAIDATARGKKPKLPVE
jgi:hypothetical protein